MPEYIPNQSAIPPPAMQPRMITVGHIALGGLPEHEFLDLFESVGVGSVAHQLPNMQEVREGPNLSRWDGRREARNPIRFQPPVDQGLFLRSQFAVPRGTDLRCDPASIGKARQLDNRA